MAIEFKVPVEGVPAGANPPVAPGIPAAPAPIAPAPAPAVPTAPAEPTTLLHQFHPQLDPAKVDITFDDKTGKMRVVRREVAPAMEPDSVAPVEVPASPIAPMPAAAVDPVADLRAQLAQTNQLVLALLQSPDGGQSLRQSLGIAAPPDPPAAPTPPDPSQFDFYDQAQAAEYHRQNAAYTQQMIQQGVREAIAPYAESMEQAKWRGQFDQVQTRYGSDPAFRNKATAAIRMVMQNPTGLTIDQAYQMVEQVIGAVAPPAQPAAPASPSTPASLAAAQPAPRTINGDQARAKAAQAQRLPADSGVRGAGTETPPPSIKGLGQLLAWNMQRADQLGR